MTDRIQDLPRSMDAIAARLRARIDRVRRSVHPTADPDAGSGADRGADRGAATAEYAITIMAAVGFAGLLVVILRSGEVQGILTDLVHRALTIAG